MFLPSIKLVYQLISQKSIIVYI